MGVIEQLQLTCSVPTFSWWKSVFLVYVVWTPCSCDPMLNSYTSVDIFCVHGIPVLEVLSRYGLKNAKSRKMTCLSYAPVPTAWDAVGLFYSHGILITQLLLTTIPRAISIDQLPSLYCCKGQAFPECVAWPFILLNFIRFWLPFPFWLPLWKAALPLSGRATLKQLFISQFDVLCERGRHVFYLLLWTAAKEVRKRTGARIDPCDTLLILASK